MNDFLNSRYRIVTYFKKTDTSSVYLVEDQLTSKHYVAKSIAKNAELILIHQFHVEVDVLSQVTHPHMPVIIDVFETQTSFVLIETYFDGACLKDYLVDHPRPSKRKTKQWVFECIEMLEHIHSKGYLYIDLKAENLIVFDDHLYLIDFNACIEMDSQNVILASKVNNAPEFYEKRELNQTSDIYGLGGIIKLFFDHGLFLLIIRKCQDKEVGKRYSSLKKVKQSFTLCCMSQRLSILLTGSILSVFLLIRLIIPQTTTPLSKYLFSKDQNYFIDAYTYTLNENEGGYETKIQTNLYKWIDSNWLSEEVLQDQENARFLLHQALQSKSISLCSYVLDMLDEQMKAKLNDLVLIANVYIGQTQHIRYADIHHFIDSLSSRVLSEYQLMEQLSIILNVVLDCEIVFDQKDLDQIYQLQLGFENVDQDIFYSLSNSYLAYGLFIKNENLEFKIPSFYKEVYKNDNSIVEVISFLGG